MEDYDVDVIRNREVSSMAESLGTAKNLEQQVSKLTKLVNRFSF